jgi:hypothetical protein
MPGNSQRCSERRDEGELAAELKYTDEQEIKTARHVPPSSMLTGAKIRFFTHIALVLYPNFTIASIRHPHELFDNEHFAAVGN